MSKTTGVKRVIDGPFPVSVLLKSVSGSHGYVTGFLHCQGDRSLENIVNTEGRERREGESKCEKRRKRG